MTDRFEEARRDARRLRLARALPARLREDGRMLCGAPRCGHDLPRWQAVAGPSAAGHIAHDVGGWHLEDEVWVKGRLTRRRRNRLERAFAVENSGDAQILSLPAYFRCPRRPEHLSVLTEQVFGTIRGVITT